jgi:hypothetical protein
LHVASLSLKSALFLSTPLNRTALSCLESLRLHVDKARLGYSTLLSSSSIASPLLCKGAGGGGAEDRTERSRCGPADSVNARASMMFLFLFTTRCRGSLVSGSVVYQMDAMLLGLRKKRCKTFSVLQLLSLSTASQTLPPLCLFAGARDMDIRPWQRQGLACEFQRHGWTHR